jgi:hypothetical protein
MYKIYTNNFLPGWMLGVKSEADLPDGAKDQGWTLMLRATHQDLTHLSQGIAAFKIDRDRFFLFKILDNELVFQSAIGGSISVAAMLCDYQRADVAEAGKRASCGTQLPAYEIKPRSPLLDRGDWMKMRKISL